MALNKYKCLPLPKELVTPESDDYAFFHSSTFLSIFGKKKRDSGIYTGSGFLKLSHGKKSLYLKYRQTCETSKQKVLLTYDNRGLLGLDPKYCTEDSAPCEENLVTVTKASWFIGNWNNRNLMERWNFRAAVIGFAALLVLDIPQFIITIAQLFANLD